MRTVIKGKADPGWFVSDILGVKLFPSQDKILRDFYRDRYYGEVEAYKKLILRAGMRSGKTALASVLGVYGLFDIITLDNPSEWYGLLRNQPIFITAVATSEKLANDGVFTNMCNIIEGSEWFNTWGDLNITNDRIAHRKKHVIAQVLSSWATTAVGRSNYMVIFDELDLFEETSGKRGAWEIYSRLRKSTDTFGRDGRVVAISSPKGANGIITQLWRIGLEEKNTLALTYKTWEMNPNLTEDELREEYKHDMATFWRDFACMPETAGGVEFPEGARLTRMENVLETLKPSSFPVIRAMAIDPAVKNDGFGIAVGRVDPSGGIIVDGVKKFMRREGDPYISPMEIRAFVDVAIQKLGVNYLIYDTWMFPDLIEHVKIKYGIDGVKHIVGKEDYDRWREMENNPENPVTVVYNDDLKRETDSLVITSAGSKPKVDHPFGGSKDVADCVANLIWFFTQHNVVDQMPDLVVFKVI
jgi:hypothetical protein